MHKMVELTATARELGFELDTSGAGGTRAGDARGCLGQGVGRRRRAGLRSGHPCRSTAAQCCRSAGRAGRWAAAARSAALLAPPDALAPAPQRAPDPCTPPARRPAAALAGGAARGAGGGPRGAGGSHAAGHQADAGGPGWGDACVPAGGGSLAQVAGRVRGGRALTRRCGPHPWIRPCRPTERALLLRGRDLLCSHKR